MATLKMFFGNPPTEVEPGEVNKIGLPVLIVLLLIISITGGFLPVAIKKLMESASGIIMGVI